MNLKNNLIINGTLGLIFLISFFYLLVIGSKLIIPFIIAILFSFAIIGLDNFYKKLKLPTFGSILLSILTYIVIFLIIGKMINSNIQELISLLPEYQLKVTNIITNTLSSTGIIDSNSLTEVLSGINLSNVFSNVFTSITSIFSSAGLILFYVLFILLEYRFFETKLDLIIGDKNKSKKVKELISRIKGDIKSYFIIKSLVSLGTAFLSYIVLISFGLDFAVFWAFLIFILNFIPSIGSIISVLFPICLSLIQFESFYPFIFISFLLIGIQILMGNIIEPKFMGNKLNLSPLVIIISLGFWGTIWGIPGMILSVPLMVMINIIFSKFEKTRGLAILLSEKGELKKED